MHIEDALLFYKLKRNLLNFKVICHNGYHLKTINEDKEEHLYITSYNMGNKIIIEKLKAYASKLYCITIRTFNHMSLWIRKSYIWIFYFTLVRSFWSFDINNDTTLIQFISILTHFELILGLEQIYFHNCTFSFAPYICKMHAHKRQYLLRIINEIHLSMINYS